MAYGTKFRFRFDSCHGTTYEVRLQEDGYSGSITDRPLGKAPVIRMQDSDPIRATTCELALECRVDGEYVDLYTLDPKQFKVEVRYKSGSSWPVVWSGFVATEIYSEPDIAPPYDVNITATDGIGVLKEYTFQESWGGGQDRPRDPPGHPRADRPHAGPVLRIASPRVRGDDRGLPGRSPHRPRLHGRKELLRRAGRTAEVDAVHPDAP